MSRIKELFAERQLDDFDLNLEYEQWAEQQEEDPQILAKELGRSYTVGPTDTETDDSSTDIFRDC